MREQLARDYYQRLYGPSLAERIKYAWEQAGQGESLKERFARVWNSGTDPIRYSMIAVQGLPRRALPQLKGDKANDFVRWLKRRGIACHETKAFPGDLLPTQRELDQRKVDSIAAKASDGWQGPPLIVSSDGSILDGHHRWAAHKKAVPMQAVPVIQVNTRITGLLELAWEWQDGESDLKEMFARVWNEEPLRYARKFREEDHPRGQPDNAGQFAEKPGGKATAKGKPKAKSANTSKVPKKKADSERVARAKASHKLVAKDVQRYAEERNEPQFAKTMKGRSLPNGEPVDVVLPNPDSPDHGIELKTMVDNGNNKLTMDSYSQVRKILWEKETGATVHTIVIDDRNVYSPDGNHKPESNRKYYYRRGVAGSARIESLHEVKSIRELRRLMNMDESDLPPKAQRTDAKLRVGKWIPTRVGKKKAFKNTKTGKVYKAKK